MPIVPHDQILRVHAAAAAAMLTASREALLAGIPQSLIAAFPHAGSASAQLLGDLDHLNDLGRLTDRSVPFQIWLENAIALCGPRIEGQVFQEVLTLARASTPDPPLGGGKLALGGSMAPSGMLVHLRVVGTPYAYQAEPGIEILSVGRQRRKAGAPEGQGNDVVVRVPGDDGRSLRISRHHLQIRRSGQGYVIADLSGGYTTLNDEPLRAGDLVALRSGNRIGLGGVLLIEFAVRDASANVIVRGPVGVVAWMGHAERVIMEASVGDMVTVRDD